MVDMTKEIIEQIRSAENKAEEMTRQANIKTKAVIADARDEAFRIRERAVMESEKEYDKLLDDSRQEALKEAATIEDKAKHEIADIRKRSRTRMEEAVEYIVGRIIKADGSY
jgi:V/A-type H+/Na+-transporting ATPase subunit G/H